MDLVKISGRIQDISPIRKVGESSTVKTVFIQEIEGEYKNSVAVDFWNDKISKLDEFSKGDIVVCQFGVSSRESSGKYFTSCRGVSIKSDL